MIFCLNTHNICLHTTKTDSLDDKMIPTLICMVHLYAVES